MSDLADQLRKLKLNLSGKQQTAGQQQPGKEPPPAKQQASGQQQAPPKVAPGREGEPRPAAKESRAPSGAGKRRISTKVTNPLRAGRAPYNFVPLPEKAITGVPKPLSADRYHQGAFSGVVTVRAEALTDFYTRGMWKLGQVGKDSDGHDKPQPLPFQVAGELRLPGSSLRGMIRNLVEIMACAPLDPVNDSQLYFRTVGSVGEPTAKAQSFEPHAKVYKGRLQDGNKLKAKPGYLYAEKDGWYIRPALDDQLYQVDHRQLDSDGQDHRNRRPAEFKRRSVNFIPENRVMPNGVRTASLVSSGGKPGIVVISGYIQKKRREWIIELEKPNGNRVPIPEEDVEAYRESGVSQTLKKKNFHFSVGNNGTPCFYVEWKEPKTGKRRVSFGHTPFFRLPYVNTVHDAIPPENRRDEDSQDWDLAQAIFGRVPTGKVDTGQKSRVCFEDGVLTQPVTPGWDTTVKNVVLNSPKPTTYQHYLVQVSQEADRSIHWDGDLNLNQTQGPVVRGHKAYLHRDGARIPTEAQPADSTTPFQAAKRGAVFSARIRFENLQPHELGALLFAIELPEGCAHKFGMGKAIGLGSFRLSVEDLSIVDREQRYRSVAASGARPATAEERSGWKGRFAAWLANPEQTPEAGSDWQALWQDPRWRELKAVLTWNGLPARWLDITRVLEFGSLPDQGGGTVTYNEYDRVGYHDGWMDGVLYRGKFGNWRLDAKTIEKRRPLPPATQVLSADQAIPRDGRPPWIATGKRAALEAGGPHGDRRPGHGGSGGGGGGHWTGKGKNKKKGGGGRPSEPWT